MAGPSYGWLGSWRAAMFLLLAMSMAGAGACPDACVCKWKGGKQTVECVNKGLPSLPEGIDPETQVLDVSGSTLQILHRVLFQRLGLVNLQRVYLARSRLGHLDDTTFQGLTNLVELDLADNMLTSVPVAALSELPALMRLSLARNPIRRVSGQSFLSLRYLSTLELSNCQIEAVEPGAFDGLKALEWLKLDGNALTSIGGTGVLPRSLHGVTLHDNPWQCDCQLGQLRAWLIQFNVPLSMEPKCSVPERVAGKMIKSLDPMDFACAPSVSVASAPVAEVMPGESVTFSCHVTGDPEPRISWFHNGQKIPATFSSPPLFVANETDVVVREFARFYYNSEAPGQRHELNVVNVSDRENGTYVCSAENRAGSSRANFTLSVLPQPTSMPPPASIEYVITVGGVVAAIVVTLVIIIVAVAVRCCCCRRRGRRTRDKASNNIAASSSAASQDAIKGRMTLSPALPPRPTQMLPMSVVKGGGGYMMTQVQSPMTDVSALDQSPDLINDTAAIKWKEQEEQQQQAVCLVDGGQYSSNLYGHVMPSVGNQYYPAPGPLPTISEAVYHQQQHYYNPQLSANNVAYPSSAGTGAVLNPAGYLPLVDADGFPIDYGLPRPCRPIRPSQPHHTVRFADPPSVSVRHYENYVLDGDNQLIQPDSKYPDAYSLSGNGMTDPSLAHQSEYRYPSERYPETSSPYPLPPPSVMFEDHQQVIPSPPKEFVYPPAHHHPSNSIETSSENSTVTTGGAPSSPLDVSGDAGSSSAFLCSSSSAIQRQPHESPDEGYEDEGIDGTEI